MRCRNKIDVLRPLFFEGKKYVAEPLRRNFFSFVLMGNGRVLTVDAPQIASGEKHRAGSVSSGKAGFLPNMQRSPCRCNLTSHTANAALALHAVCTTFSRTNAAVCKRIHQLMASFSAFAS